MKFIFTRKPVFALILFLLFAQSIAAYSGNLKTDAMARIQEKTVVWQPADTLVLLVGVLSWQDKSLSTFVDTNRYDQKLYETLLKRGVKRNNIIFLKDEQARLANIKDNLQNLANKSNEKSVFFFYYAGHGDPAEDGKDAYFLNYDCATANLASTSLHLSNLAEVLKKEFKGKKVILAADCCYSGYLNQVADELEKANINTLVMSSASANNESTGEWTFTRSLDEILSGRPLFKDAGAELSASFAQDYIRYNMTYAEAQLANHYQTKGFPKKFILAKKQQGYDKNKPYLGQIKLTKYEGNYCKVRIIDQEGDNCKILFAGFDPNWEEWRNYSELKDIVYKNYPVNSKIMVEWNKKWYKATVLKTNGVFHFVHYNDFESNWDEWVTSNRMKK